MHVSEEAFLCICQQDRRNTKSWIEYYMSVSLLYMHTATYEMSYKSATYPIDHNLFYPLFNSLFLQLAHSTFS